MRRFPTAGSHIAVFPRRDGRLRSAFSHSGGANARRRQATELLELAGAVAPESLWHLTWHRVGHAVSKTLCVSTSCGDGALPSAVKVGLQHAERPPAGCTSLSPDASWTASWHLSHCAPLSQSQLGDGALCLFATASVADVGALADVRVGGCERKV